MRNTFARTLDEAFGLDARSACAVTCYRRKSYGWLLWAVIAAGGVVLLTLR
jgi:hypothetical protein